MEATHASFFSGVGGLDMGLERAGWHTVSFSEIDPYASAVLAQRWPGVPNLGDIVGLARADVRHGRAVGDPRHGERTAGGGLPVVAANADLWTGGFPCQDLSVAGKRRGFGIAHGRRGGQPAVGADLVSEPSGSESGHGSGGSDRSDGPAFDTATRSGLAFAFLDLVERHRPPAVLLENVPGLLSSHAGRDLGALLGRLGELGYGWAYRVLDARHFGVPQRRRRVFILGIHARVDPSGQRATEVLSVGTRCPRHPATGHEAGPGVADGADERPDGPGRTYSVGSARAWYEGVASLGARDWKSTNHIHVGPSPDADRDRAPDGLAGRVDGGRGVAATLNSGGNNGGFRTEPGEHLVAAFNPYRTLEQDGSVTSGWAERPVVDALHGPTGNKEPLVVGAIREHVRPGSNTDHSVLGDFAPADDALLPLGLDSHRYRCCGNGVVSSVSEWVGRRLLEVMP